MIVACLKRMLGIHDPDTAARIQKSESRDRVADDASRKLHRVAREQQHRLQRLNEFVREMQHRG